MSLNPAPADEKSDQMFLQLEDIRANTLINDIRDRSVGRGGPRAT